MPRCSRCKEEKGADQFTVSRAATSGLQNYCIVCRRELNWEAAGIVGFAYEQYYRLVTEQDGLCAICDEPPGDGRELDVDHDHVSGAVRALLCMTCNTSVGLLESEWRSRGEAYLAKHRKEQG